MYNIRFCKTDEIEKLQHFIDLYWKKEHILARNENLLRWQHFNIKENQYNFIIAYDSKNDDFAAILGIIPTWHYDTKLFDEKDFWLTIWKVKDEKCIKQGLGVDLLAFLEKKYAPNSIAAIGISDIAKKLYRIFGYKVGELVQYYFLNPNVSSYKIAEVSAPSGRPYIKSRFSIIVINDLRKVESFTINMRPKKTIEYLYNRYTKHLLYTYDFYGVYLLGKLEVIFITRTIMINGTRCLRIVDIMGNIDKMSSLESELDKLLVENDAEYIDCLNYGINETTFHDMGFLTRMDNVIIPNYFEPFEKRNVDITFAYKTDYEDYVIFKGDSDQDRPNIV